jgi:hypothetical protein
MPSIHAALHAIMCDFEVITKDRKGFNFQYRGIDDALGALHPLLCKHGVIVLPDVEDYDIGSYETKKGAKMRIDTVRTSYRFVSIEDGSEVLVRSFGEGSDDSDKASGKALSSAFKSMVWTTFVVPTEEPELDVESRDEEIAAAPAAPSLDMQEVIGWARDRIAGLGLEADDAHVRTCIRDAAKTLDGGPYESLSAIPPEMGLALRVAIDEWYAPELAKPAEGFDDPPETEEQAKERKAKMRAKVFARASELFPSLKSAELRDTIHTVIDPMGIEHVADISEKDWPDVQRELQKLAMQEDGEIRV